jgi:hypothetical protein
MMKSIKLTLIAAAVCAASSAFAANYAGEISQADHKPNDRQIKVGEGKTDVHTGKAAINVIDVAATPENPRKGLANGKYISFAKIDETAGSFIVNTFAPDVLGKDKSGVTVAHMFKMKGFLWRNIPKMPDHSHLGRMSYGKVGNLDVYYGDWDNTPSGASKVNTDTKTNNYTVFYSGTGKTTNMPTSGTATYAVKGINQHYEQGTAVLGGDLKADFGKKTLVGTLSRTTGDLKKLGIDAKIVTSDASFSGKAVANGSVNGATRGNFFGNNAAGLAGIADFGKNNPNNTAFGGAKK